MLLGSHDRAIVHFTRRDLLHEEVGPVGTVHELPEVRRLLRNQRADGAWAKAGKDREIYPPDHYCLVETYKRFRLLTERYQLNRETPAVALAAEYLFSFQTAEGDIRGFIGNQYATYYTGYVLALLAMAGYARDPRVAKGLRWLLSVRQDDGGWTVPVLCVTYDRRTWIELTSRFRVTVPPDRGAPSAHTATDMVLRGFAAHPTYRQRSEAKAAGALLKSRFFRPDAYTSYQSPRYWTRFRFWWPNLLTSLESLAHLGFSADDPEIGRALTWFVEHQERDGLWKLESGKPTRAKDTAERLWLALRICRTLRTYCRGR